ncbi:hypothetical protein Gotur_032706 [Gossypium turneri]
MFYFIIRTSFVHGRQTIAASQSSNLLIFKRPIGLRLFSNSSNAHSFTVSYLINKCGFSPELASRVSNFVHFETPEKPDSLIVFLENHGFSQTQIANLIKRQPRFLLSDTEKTLLPKLEFLYSMGFSRPELAKLLSSHPHLLKYSLKKQIIPSFNLLRDLFQSDDKTIKAIKRFAAFLYSPVRLKEIVEEVKGMGIDSSTKKFLVAVLALRSMSKSTLEKKFDVYRRWGWSDQEIREAFQRYPPCIAVSEDKIMAIMDFLVNKMGYNSTLIAKQSSVLSRSLRIIVPRALFAQELLSQGLLAPALSFSSLIFRRKKIRFHL